MSWWHTNISDPLGDTRRHVQEVIAYADEHISDMIGDEEGRLDAQKQGDYLDQQSNPQRRPAYLKKWDHEQYKTEFPDLYAADVAAARGAGASSSGENNVSDTTTTNGVTDPAVAAAMPSGPEQIDYAALMDLQEKAAERASAFNLQFGRDLAPEVLDQTTDTAQALDASLRAEMDRLYPGMRQSTAQYSQEALDATRKAAAEFSTGNVPQDVQDYQQRLAASLGISRGAFGTAPNYGLARNLGATSLQMKQYGTQLYAGIPTMSAQILQNARTTMPAMNQLPQMYDSAYARAFSASAMPTGAFMGSLASAMGQNANLAQDQNQFNTSLDWTKQLSAMNQASEAQRLALQLQMQQQAIDAQKKGQQYNLWGSVIGAGIQGLSAYWNSGGGKGTGSTINYNYNSGTAPAGSSDYPSWFSGSSGSSGSQPSYSDQFVNTYPQYSDSFSDNSSYTEPTWDSSVFDYE